MEKALPFLQLDPQSFAAPQYPGDNTERLALRDGHYAFDNTGYCKDTIAVAFFSGMTPARNANCKPNEVEVPNVVGQSLASATLRLKAQPLRPTLIYKPAAPRQRLDVVVGQIPPRGTLSSYDEVKLVLPKALHGVVPRLVGLTANEALARVRALHLRPHVSGGDALQVNSYRTRVIRQLPAPGLAAAPGMPVTLFVAAG
jgi:beta-lactam-binding protein with PASTA domain